VTISIQKLLNFEQGLIVIVQYASCWLTQS